MTARGSAIDKDLVLRAQRGESDAFAELFQRLHKPILNYVYRLLKDQPSAEDITQDAFLRAHQQIEWLGPPYDFKSWVYRIAGNLALNYLKRESRLVQVDEFDELNLPHDQEGSAESSIEQRELQGAVWKALADLPTAYRQALILREFNELSYKEIGVALERSYDNVRQMVHRARLRFAEAHLGRLMVEQGSLTCTVLGDVVSAFVDDELQPDQRRAVQSHIDTCADCQATQSRLRKSAALLAVIPFIFPSKAWAAELTQQIHEQELSIDRGGGALAYRVDSG